MRFCTAFLFLFLLAAPIGAHADDAATLLLKHRAFVGWESGAAAMQDQSYSERQTITSHGKTVYNDGQIWRHDLVFRETVAYGSGGGNDEGFNGRMFWESNRNKFVHPQLGKRAETSYDYDLIMDEALTLVPNPELRGSDTIDGKPVTIVRLKPRNSLPMDVYIDPQGAFRRVVIDPDGTKAIFNILGYRDLPNGCKVIKEYQWYAQPSWKVGEVHTDARVTPADVSPPLPQATWTFKQQQPLCGGVRLAHLQRERCCGKGVAQRP